MQSAIQEDSIIRAGRSFIAFALVLAYTMAVAAGDPTGDAAGWKLDEARKYLDAREKAWLAFDSRGEGPTRSSCISCHTVLPYALALPVLRQFDGGRPRSEEETQLLAQTRMRVANWSRLDTKELGLYYIDSERKKNKLCNQLLAAQQSDGGWRLPSLGTWVRRDGSPQERASDGYATGLAMHVLHLAGMSTDDPRLDKGRQWLWSHQSAAGAWRTVSLIKKRDPASHVGKFMSDAATALGVLALSD